MMVLTGYLEYNLRDLEKTMRPLREKMRELNDCMRERNREVGDLARAIDEKRLSQHEWPWTVCPDTLVLEGKMQELQGTMRDLRGTIRCLVEPMRGLEETMDKVGKAAVDSI